MAVASPNEEDDVDSKFEQLLTGPLRRLDEVQKAVGGPAGVATIWFDGSLLCVVVAQSAAESKQSNADQADGIRGRLIGFTRQPPRRVIDWFQNAHPRLDRMSGADLRKAVTGSLQVNGRYRVVEVQGRAQARELRHAFLEACDAAGLVPECQ